MSARTHASAVMHFLKNYAIIATMRQTAVKQIPLPRPDPAVMSRQADTAARFLKLMANPNRLMILCHLLDTELSVSELNTHLPLSQSALSQHLALLRNSGLVNTRRDQQTIYYSLASEEVHAVMAVLYEQFCRPR